MLHRRDVLKGVAAGGLGLWHLPHSLTWAREQGGGLYGVHPFVWSHPEAVFIMRTQVDVKTDAAAKLAAGREFARRIFLTDVPAHYGGIPLHHTVAIKPNLTGDDGSGTKDPSQIPETMGIVTDADFVEGLITGLQDLGIPGNRFYLREMNGPMKQGYPAMAERVGAAIRGFGGFRSRAVDTLEPHEIVWLDVPKGRVVVRYPYLWPINAPESFCLNVAKFKAHSMGLTLCAKNFQGVVAGPYQHFCGKESALQEMRTEDVHPQALEHLKTDFERHRAEGIIPRWDKPAGSDVYCPWTQETWAARTLDSLSVSKIGLHVVEGIYGRDGNGFLWGPHNGLAQDHMTNLLIFGMDPYRVDIIGHWLGGHEPGNFGFFHIALERGLSTILDPRKIPVYLWESDHALRTPLQNLERTPLVTRYLQRDYNGEYEPEYHLLDDPFDYSRVRETPYAPPAQPAAFILYQSLPRSRYPQVCFEYRLPRTGEVRVALYNERDECIAVPAMGLRETGAHLAVWNLETVAPGTYQYRYQWDGFAQSGNISIA